MVGGLLVGFLVCGGFVVGWRGLGLLAGGLWFGFLVVAGFLDFGGFWV